MTTKQAFADYPQSKHPVQARITSVGTSTVDLVDGTTIIRNAKVAEPLTIEKLRINQVVALVWTGAQAHVTAILGELNVKQFDPLEDVTPPPAPINVRVVQLRGGARLQWDYRKKELVEQIAYFEVDAKKPGGTYGFDAYPVSTGAQLFHFPATREAIFCRVRAHDRRGNHSSWVNCNTILEDKEPPFPPRIVKCVLGYKNVTLKWEYSHATEKPPLDLSHFEVWQAEAADGTDRELVEITTSHRSVLDLSDEFDVVYLNVRAVDYSGNTSDWGGPWTLAYVLGPGGPNLLPNSEFDRDENSDDIPDGYSIPLYQSGGTWDYGEFGWNGSKGIELSINDEAYYDMGYHPAYSGVGNWVWALDDHDYWLSAWVWIPPHLAWALYDGSNEPGALTLRLSFLWCSWNGTAWDTTAGSGYPQLLETLGGGWYRIGLMNNSGPYVAEGGPAGSNYKYFGMNLSVYNDTGSTAVVRVDRVQIAMGSKPPVWVADPDKPEAPANLAVLSGIECIVVKMDGPTQLYLPTLKDFRLFMATDSSGSNAQWVRDLPPALHHVVPLPAGTQGYWNVKSRDEHGNLSSYGASTWLLAVSVLASGGQLLTNADLERPGYAQIRSVDEADDWTHPYISGDPNIIYDVADHGYGGSHCCFRLKTFASPTTAAAKWPYRSSNPPLIPGAEGAVYTLSAHLKPLMGSIGSWIDEASGYLVLKAFSYVGGTWYNSCAFLDSGYHELQNGWYRVWFRWQWHADTTPEPDAIYLGFQAIFDGSTIGQGDCAYLDRLRLEIGSRLTDFSLTSQATGDTRGLSMDSLGIISQKLHIDDLGRLRSHLTLERMLDPATPAEDYAVIYLDGSDEIAVRHDDGSIVSLEDTSNPHSLTSSEHTDVNVGSLSDGDVLAWDTGTSKWVNEAITSGNHSLTGSEHTDVNVGTLVDGDVLVWDDGTSKWINEAPSGASSHVLATTSGLGAYHSTSGLTAGQVLRATGATTAAFQQLAHTDLGSVTANQHHNQSHVLATVTALGPDHSVSGLTAGYVLRATGATTAAFQQLAHTDLGSVTSDQHHAQSHVLASTSGLGPYHTVSGLSVGQVLRAESSGSAKFQQLAHADLGSVSADQHHAGFVGLKDHSDTTVAPDGSDYIKLATANNILTIAAGTNLLTLTIVEANISHDAIADVSPNDHHNQQHALSGSDHTGDLAWVQIDSLITTPSITLGTTPAQGSAETMIRSDATIMAFDTTLPTTINAGTGTSATGTATVASRRDHVHGIGTAAPSTNLSVTSTNQEGTGTSFSRATHVHDIETSDNPGVAASILATNGSGLLTLQHLTVSGNFSVGKVNSHLIPLATDTYDLGSSTLLWRKGWLSELDAIRLVENTASVMGGWFIIPHASGTLAEDVDDTETDIDFGSTLSVNDFILLRGNGQVEYMQVTAFVSGTIYTVTRNLDGSGANAWPQGHVWVNLGYTGDGRIELDAQTGSPRISMMRQGATYNAQTELVRLGDLNGWGPYSSETWGMAIGDYSGGDYIKYDPTNGMVIAGDGAGVTNINGGYIQTGTVDTDQLAADSVTAEKIDVTNLAAVNTSTGALTVDNTLTMSTGAVLKCGATAYNSGVGYWLEYNAGTPRMFLGDASTGKLLWDGTSLKIHTTAASYIDLSGSTIAIYANSELAMQFQNDGDARFGVYGAGKANLFWDASEGDLALRIAGTNRIALDASADTLTIGDTATGNYLVLSSDGIAGYGMSVQSLSINAGNGNLVLGSSTTGYASLHWVSSSGDLLLRMNGNNRIVFDTSLDKMTLGNTTDYLELTSSSMRFVANSIEMLNFDAATGDLVVGSTTASKANLWWDYSAGQLSFRQGTGTAQAYIDTDGKLYAAGGLLYLDESGIAITPGTAYNDLRSFKFVYSGTTYAKVDAYRGSGENFVRLAQNKVTGCDAYAVLSAQADTNKDARSQLEAKSSSGNTSALVEVVSSESTSTAYCRFYSDGYVRSDCDIRIDGGLRVGDSTTDPPDNCVTIVGGLTVGGNSDAGSGNANIQGGLRVGSLGTVYDNDVTAAGGGYFGNANVDAIDGYVQATVGMSGWFPFANYAVLGYQITTNGGRPYAGTISRDITIRSWHQALWVDTTNNASNYWTVNLKDGGGANVLSFNTSGYAPDTFYVYTTTGLSVSKGTSNSMLYVQVAKTGSPGAISLPCPALFVT